MICNKKILIEDIIESYEKIGNKKLIKNTKDYIYNSLIDSRLIIDDLYEYHNQLRKMIIEQSDITPLPDFIIVVLTSNILMCNN